jgi:hypothetical protein
MNRILVPAAALSVFAVACIPGAEALPEKATPVVESPALPAGEYQVQSIAFDDANGAYQVFLLDPPAGHGPNHTTTGLRLARLTDEEIAGGKKSHLIVDAEGPTAMLVPEFQIAITHNLTEPRDGETVVVRQETSTWSPFMSAMSGAMVANMLFMPRYYYPPPYFKGGPLMGFGGTGATRELAAGNYTSIYGTPPKTTVLSKTGYSKMPSSSLKSTGSGAGASRLKTTKPSSPMKRSPFGGGGRMRRR